MDTEPRVARERIDQGRMEQPVSANRGSLFTDVDIEGLEKVPKMANMSYDIFYLIYKASGLAAAIRLGLTKKKLYSK
jgi:hypothetical protein